MSAADEMAVSTCRTPGKLLHSASNHFLKADHRASKAITQDRALSYRRGQRGHDSKDEPASQRKRPGPWRSTHGYWITWTGDEAQRTAWSTRTLRMAAVRIILTCEHASFSGRRQIRTTNTKALRNRDSVTSRTILVHKKTSGR